MSQFFEDNAESRQPATGNRQQTLVKWFVLSIVREKLVQKCIHFTNYTGVKVTGNQYFLIWVKTVYM